MLKKFTLFGRLVLLSFILILGSCDELPDRVEISDIPSYYFDNDYLDNRAQSINDAIKDCTDGCETFFWITDMHWEPDLNTRKSPLLIKYLASKTGINKVLKDRKSVVWERVLLGV